MDHRLSIRGAQLHVCTRGAGAPTVLFEAGASSDSSEWEGIASVVAHQATTLVYDRRGTGASSPIDGPRTLRDIVDDLELVIETLRPPTPFLLVGHSLGGLIVRLYAARHSAEVLGLVLVDPTHEQMLERFEAALSSPAFLVLLDGNSVAAEGLDLVRELRSLPAIPVQTKPLRVLSAAVRNRLPNGIPTEIATELTDALDTIAPSLHRQLAGSSPQGKYTIVHNAGHDIHRVRPDVVIEEILAMLSRAPSRSAQS